MSSTTKTDSPLPAAGCNALLDNRHILGHAWQEKAKRRANSGLAVNADMSARLLDEAEDHAEAEAGALVPAFGREERLKNPMHDLRGHAASGVADFEHDVAARNNLGVLRGIIGVEDPITGHDHQTPAIGHGVAGIGGQIGQARFELGRVDDNRPQLSGEVDISFEPTGVVCVVDAPLVALLGKEKPGEA